MKKIKVLHLTTHINIGGITTYIMLLGRGMKNSAYELSVLSSGGEMKEKMEEEGLRIFELPFKTKSEISPKLYLNLPQVIGLVKKEKFDLIHAHTRVTQVMAWWIQKITGVPFVTTSHGFYKYRFGRRIMPCWGEQVIAISPPVADWLVDGMHVPKDRVSVILNAIDIDDLETRAKQKNKQDILKEWNLQPNEIIVGIVSRLVYDKGHEYLIRAISNLKKRYPKLKLLIAGEGPFKGQIIKLVHQTKLNQSVLFLGNLTDVTKALAVIDIFVLPAVWREGFGLSIVEAMALKKPVIVTNIWALNALVHDHVNGLLIEPKNVNSLEHAITEFIESPDLREKIGICGYETAKEQFSVGRMCSEINNLYQKILSRS